MLTNEISTLTILILAFILFDFLLNYILDSMNAKSWDNSIPIELASIYDEEKYSKARSYNIAKGKLSNIENIPTLPSNALGFCEADVELELSSTPAPPIMNKITIPIDTATVNPNSDPK